MGHIFTAYSDFSKKFKGINPKDNRIESLKRYFARGGVISVEGKGKGWPKLVYPSASRIHTQVQELKARKSIYDKQYSEWKKSHDSAKMYDVRNEVMKYSDLLYWKHTVRYHSDKDYKKDADSVKLPVHLVSDDRWKPMIRMFVEDSEYRSNLVETVNNSIVYKNDKKVAKYASELKEFRMAMSSKAVSSLAKKIEQIELEIKSLEDIASWASGK